METFFAALQIMGKGMAGIFAAAMLIWFAVWIMGKVFSEKEGKEDAAGATGNDECRFL